MGQVSNFKAYKKLKKKNHPIFIKFLSIYLFSRKRKFYTKDTYKYLNVKFFSKIDKFKQDLISN
jgi:hypothetical protein